MGRPILVFSLGFFTRIMLPLSDPAGEVRRETRRHRISRQSESEVSRSRESRRLSLFAGTTTWIWNIFAEGKRRNPGRRELKRFGNGKPNGKGIGKYLRRVQKKNWGGVGWRRRIGRGTYITATPVLRLLLLLLPLLLLSHLACSTWHMVAGFAS